MYIPGHYRMEDKEQIVSFIRAYSFAPIISMANGRQEATHLPFIIQEDGDTIKLISHFAKANSQWKNVEDRECLVIFSEPHAYISPRHYEKEQNVPTWNYLSVHVYGKVEIITNEKASLDLLEAMIETFEEGYKKQWDQLPFEYKERMLRGIVPFELRVTEIQAKQKLSQNKTRLEQERISEQLGKSVSSLENQVAAYMKENLKRDA